MSSFFIRRNVVADTTATREIYHRVTSDSVEDVGWIGNELVEVSAPSSLSAKSDLQPLETVSEKFDRLRAFRYKVTSCAGEDPKDDIGLIAEDMEILFPEFVRYTPDGTIKGIHYDRLVTILIKEIQDLKVGMEEMYDALIIKTEMNSRETADLRKLVETLKAKVDTL